jgi:hypothetical protein
LQEIGQRELGRARSLHGVAIVKAKHIREAELEIRAGEPPPRHADIIGWPWAVHDPDFGKAERKEQAAWIAQKAGKPLLFEL